MENFGLVAPTPDEIEQSNSLLGRLGRGITGIVNDPRKMAMLGGLGQGLLQAGAVSQRPINWSEAMAMGMQGANQMTRQYDDDMFRQHQMLMKQLAASKQGGPFGDSMQGRAWEVILSAQQDPSVMNTPEYAAAVAIIERPTIMQGPEGAIDMTQRLPSAFGRPGQFTPPAADAPVHSQPVQAMGQQPASQQPAQPAPQQNRPAVIPGTERLSADQKEYDKAFESLSSLQREFNDYRSALDTYGVQYGIGGRGVSSRGDYSPEGEQKLMSRHKSLQLALKSPELFALGVLAGPDMDILDGFLPSPTQVRTLIKDGGIEAAESRIRTGYNEAARFINNKISAYNSRWEGAPIKAKQLPTLELLPSGSAVSGQISTPDQAKGAGWTLMTDANGNQAYVGPNNQIIEVK